MTFIKQHFLFEITLKHALRPCIDSEINHIKHFVKIPFTNIKEIDFIDLPSTFTDKTVESSIPNYFEYKEPLIFYYKNTLIESFNRSPFKFPF